MEKVYVHILYTCVYNIAMYVIICVHNTYTYTYKTHNIYLYNLKDTCCS